MINFLFETSYWPPRWNCGYWTDALGYTHIVSDLLIFLAYFAIPCILVYFCYKMKGIQLESIFILFALFIVFCGTIHLVEAIIFYIPIYRFAALVKACTAIVSWLTVFALIPFVKKFLNLPKLQLINKELMENLENERKQLRVTLEELTKSHKKLEDFSYRVAHDLKSPVRGIYSYATILLESEEDLEINTFVEERVKKIQNASKQSLKMIDEILQYATLDLDAGEKSLVQVEEMLHEVLEEIADPDGNIHIEIEKQLPPLYANYVTLREVFRNLIMNGIKYNDSNQKEIHIGSTLNNQACTYFVQDNGVGLTEEAKKEIFESGRVKTQRHSNSGTGLGLMLVKKTIQEHNGKLWVESHPGEGTTFYFSFPSEKTDGSNNES